MPETENKQSGTLLHTRQKPDNWITLDSGYRLEPVQIGSMSSPAYQNAEVTFLNGRPATTGRTVPKSHPSSFSSMLGFSIEDAVKRYIENPTADNQWFIEKKGDVINPANGYRIHAPKKPYEDGMAFVNLPDIDIVANKTPMSKSGGKFTRARDFVKYSNK